MADYHISVLPKETINYLDVKRGEKYIDCTLGGGGHTKAILGKGGLVLGIDQDPEAIQQVKERLDPEITDRKLVLKHGNFAHLKDLVTDTGFGSVAGILFDLGVSSHQLETDYRGFSFKREAKLDMRMDPITQTVTAADLVNAGSERELSHLFWQFGEERDSRRIAKAIVEQREKGRINTVDQLAELIVSVSRRSQGDRTHPATRVFQALRIAVNDELDNLATALAQAVELLAPQGRLVVISFHSLEDRIVKDFYKSSMALKIITDKPVIPTDEEIHTNPRARSGKLRAAEKLLANT